MYAYYAYGLSICSDLPLPELQISTETRADVVIQLGTINWSPPVPQPEWSYFHIDGDSAYFYWKVVGKFQVNSGTEIIIEPLSNAEEDVIRLPLLGAVLAMILYQRQHLVLHASAVAINGQAALFLGASGQGKSTMAATLYGRGHKLMADDVAAINLENPTNPILIPGFPQIKLYPEALTAALGDDAESLKRVHPEVEKRTRPTLDNFLQTPLTLKRIYILSQGSRPEIKLLQRQEAVVQLIRNSFIPMLLGNEFLQSSKASLHLHQCTSVAQNLPIYILERPRCLDLLSDIARLVEEDLAGELEPIMI